MSILSKTLALLLLASPALADGLSSSMTPGTGGGFTTSGQSPFSPCTGGTRTSASGKTIITFTASGTLTCPSDFLASEVLVVAGGGSGTVGGGGAGGVIDVTNAAVSSGSTTVTVGTGGTGTAQGPNNPGNPGTNSVFGSMVAVGGGAGGTNNGGTPATGGSGGGCGANSGGCTGGLGTGPISFNCSSGFAASGSCGVQFPGAGSAQAFGVVGTTNGTVPALSGAAVNLINAGGTHVALSMNYMIAPVSAVGFTTVFTFVPNGWNISFVLNNSNNNPTFNGANFSGGAGCEAGFFQGFAQAAPPNNLFAMELDQWSSLTGGDSTFTYSSAQIYNTGVQHAGSTPSAVYPGQSPCNPDLGTDMSPGTYTYVGTNKFSTSPVALNSPSNSQNTTTGHTYSATLQYSGTTLTLNLFDVTAGGSCPGASCYTQNWTGINIPTIVGANTAWVGLMAGTNAALPNPLLINSWTFTPSGSAGAQGNNGGTTGGFGGNFPGGGGGGCGAPGTNATSTLIAGNGGNGCSSSISGAAVTYGGGGGGSLYNGAGTPGTGGTGGGGAGSFATNNGTNGLGGGGGGSSATSGSGGSGVVIISCTTGTC